MAGWQGAAHRVASSQLLVLVVEAHIHCIKRFFDSASTVTDNDVDGIWIK